MNGRPSGSATISFGLVSIPVKIYPATASSAGITFNNLHKKCGARLKQQFVCPTDNEVVGRDDMVKGYEFAKGQYVTFTEEELAALEAVSTETVEIVEFVPLAKVDPVYFERPSYLGPDRGGEKAYRLLAEAMRKTGRCALARYAARGKQYLVLVRPAERGLVLQTLRYADEVRPFTEVPVPDVEVKEPELKLAVQLVEQSAADAFRPEAYEDDVKKRIEALIQQKVEGREVRAAPPEQPKAQIVDLMEALRASLAARPGGAVAGEPAPAAERKPARHAEEAPKEARAKNLS
jgi:DNA end-binding protein Ku